MSIFTSTPHLGQTSDSQPGCVLGHELVQILEKGKQATAEVRTECSVGGVRNLELFKGRFLN